MVLAMGDAADGQGEVGVPGAGGQPLQLLVVHPDAGRDRAEQAAPRSDGPAAARAQVGAAPLERRPAPDQVLAGQEHGQRGPADAGQERGAGVAGPAQHPAVGGGHGQEQVGHALAVQDRLDPGRLPGGHGPEQGRVVGQDGHGLLGPVGPGAEGHHGRRTA
jgi:hypothetical protein